MWVWPFSASMNAVEVSEASLAVAEISPRFVSEVPEVSISIRWMMTYEFAVSISEVPLSWTVSAAPEKTVGAD